MSSSNSSSRPPLERGTIGFAILFCIALIGLAVFSPEQTLDSRLVYSAEEARQYITNLSPEETQSYTITCAIDLVFILAYTGFLLSFVIPRRSGLFFFLVAPGAFDLMETLSILGWLVSGTEPAILAYLPFVTLLKWVFAAGAVVLFLYALVRRGKNSFPET